MANEVGKWKVNIYKGATFKRTITLVDDDGVTPIDLTGYNASWYIRTKINGELLHEFHTLDSDAEIALDELGGSISVILDVDITSAFDVSSAIHSLDLVEPDLEVSAFLEGPVIIHSRATL